MVIFTMIVISRSFAISSYKTSYDISKTYLHDITEDVVNTLLIDTSLDIFVFFFLTRLFVEN